MQNREWKWEKMSKRQQPNQEAENMCLSSSLCFSSYLALTLFFTSTCTTGSSWWQCHCTIHMLPIDWVLLRSYCHDLHGQGISRVTYNLYHSVMWCTDHIFTVYLKIEANFKMNDKMTEILLECCFFFFFAFSVFLSHHISVIKKILLETKGTL